MYIEFENGSKIESIEEGNTTRGKIKGYMIENYGEWVKEALKNDTATIERNIEKVIYVHGKENSDIIKTEIRRCDVITIKH